jgi:hypothetical protein
MKRWTLLWYPLGGGPPCHYHEDFFDWWTQVTFCINEYCYAGMDYRGDPDLPLPVDAQWGDIGMSSYFLFFNIYDFFYGVKSTNMFVLFEPDARLVRLEGQLRHMQRARAPDSTETDRVFHQVERHLDRITAAVPMAEIKDLPVAYQHQVTGVPRTWI